LAIGVFIANSHHYFTHLNSLASVLSALLAVVLWPLILFGVNLHIKYEASHAPHARSVPVGLRLQRGAVTIVWIIGRVVSLFRGSLLLGIVLIVIEVLLGGLNVF
jgi:hypothetical protein